MKNGAQLKEFKKTTTTAKTVKKVSNISYRQINDWDEKGILPFRKRKGEKGWRKFKRTDLIILMIVSLLREQGIPILKLRKLCNWINQKKWMEFLLKNVFLFRSEMYLCSDLEENFLMLPDEDLEDHVLVLSNKPTTVLHLNPLVETLCKALKLNYPKTEITKRKTDLREVFKTIKRRIETNPYQKITLLVKGSKIVNIKSVADKNLDRD